MPIQTDKYYHFTNRSGADAIKASGVIKQSKAAGAAFGAGVYFTDLDPNYYFRNEIRDNNYGGISNQFLTNGDYVVLIDKSSLDPAYLKTHIVASGRRVFSYTRDIRVQPNQVIDKPTCRYCADKLFHYTSTTIGGRIKSNLKIKQADNGPFGHGVLLTELNPYANYRNEILQNNYGGPAPSGHENRADWVVIVDRNTLSSGRLEEMTNIGTRNIFIYKGDISVLAKHVKDKPEVGVDPNASFCNLL